MRTNETADRLDRDHWSLDHALDAAPDRDRCHGRNEDRIDRIDWAASCRLALVVSIVAAAAALLVSHVVGETAVVVAVIVAGTAASWFHLEHGHLSRPVPVRHDRVHHR